MLSEHRTLDRIKMLCLWVSEIHVFPRKLLLEWSRVILTLLPSKQTIFFWSHYLLLHFLCWIGSLLPLLEVVSMSRLTFKNTTGSFQRGLLESQWGSLTYVFTCWCFLSRASSYDGTTEKALFSLLLPTSPFKCVSISITFSFIS